MLLPCKRLKIKKTFETLEPLGVDIRVSTTDMVITGIYHPPKAVSGDYQLQLEDELSSICTWAFLQRDSVAVIGDLNLGRLRPDKSAGKLLLDLEVENEFTCLIDKATRTEQKGSITTSTLIDILLTNKPDQFKCGGIYHPSLSDHALIYGILKGKRPRQPSKVITFEVIINLIVTSLLRTFLKPHGTLVKFLMIWMTKSTTGILC